MAKVIEMRLNNSVTVGHNENKQAVGRTGLVMISVIKSA